VPPDRHSEVKEALRRFLYVPFRFEWEGSVCVYYVPSSSALPC
jgi:hypothetical protein